MSVLDPISMGLYNSGPMDVSSMSSNSIDSGPVGYVGKIKKFKDLIVNTVHEYWDSALSLAAGYLFSGVSVAMIAGGLVVECVDYISKRNGESESPFEDYLSENINRIFRNTLLLPSGLFLSDPKPMYLLVSLMLGGLAYGFHWNHHSTGRKLPEEESTEDKST